HNDTITIDLSGYGGVRVTLNGEVAEFDPGYIWNGQVIGIHHIIVNSGNGNDQINVLRTSAFAPVDIVSDGNATVTVGNAGSVQGIQGTLTIQNPPSYTTVNVDDSNDGVFRP